MEVSATESLGYCELKHVDEEWSKVLDQRKDAKLQWLQNPSQIHGYNLKNVPVKRESSRSFSEGKSER
jgi:hypothetical protein